MTRFLVSLMFLLGLAAPAGAQEVIDANTVNAATVTLTGGSTSVTSGSAAPSASATPGSFYQRTNGQWYIRNGSSAWVTPFDTAGAVTTLGTVGSLTGFGVHVLPTTSDTFDLGSPFKLWRKGYVSEMNAVLFAKETQQLYGGWLSVSKNAGTLAASVASADTTVDFGTAMTLNQFVLIRAADNNSGAITSEFMKVGTLVSGTRYNVTRNLSGLGAKDWATGTPFMVRGVTGDGWLELNAFDTPRMSVFTQGSLYNNSTENIRIGHLTGMPNSSSGIGMYMGDATKFIRWDGTDLKIGSNNVTVDNAGMRIIPSNTNGTGVDGNGLVFPGTVISGGKSGLFGTEWVVTSSGSPVSRVTTSLNNAFTSDTLGYAVNVMQAAANAGSASVTVSAGVNAVSGTDTGTVFLSGTHVEASSGLYERGRTVRMGEWETQSFAAGNFTASGSMTWTVAAGDVYAAGYSLVGKSLTYSFGIQTSTVGGTANNALLITLPASAICLQNVDFVYQYYDGATAGQGLGRCAAGSAQLTLYKSFLAPNWPLTTDNTFVSGIVTVPIQ